MALALIAFDFDPVFRLGDLVVRWETLALAATVVIAVSLAALLAGQMPAVDEAYPELGGRERGASHLRRDDLLFILLGAIPGAVLAGRLGYILIHLDYYGAHPEYWFDPGQGSLELSLGVLGGTAAGVLVAKVLEAPVGRWLHVVIVPLLVGLGLGKLAMVLGGDGQGPPSDLAWATAFLGPGPWGSLAPEMPSHPAQAYEGLLVLIVATLVVGLLLSGRFREQDGRAFFAGLSLWALARVESGFLWRDAEVLGPFRAAQVVAVLIAAGSLGLFVWRVTQTGRRIQNIRGARFRIGRPAITVPIGFSSARPSPLARPAPVRPRYGVGPLAQAHRDAPTSAPASLSQTAAAASDDEPRIAAATSDQAVSEAMATVESQPSPVPGPVSWPEAPAAEPAPDQAFEPEPVFAVAAAADLDRAYEPEPLNEPEPVLAAGEADPDRAFEPEPKRAFRLEPAPGPATQLEFADEFEPEHIDAPEPVPARARAAAFEPVETEASAPEEVAPEHEDLAAAVTGQQLAAAAGERPAAATREQPAPLAGQQPPAARPPKRAPIQPVHGASRRHAEPLVPAGGGWLTAAPSTTPPATRGHSAHPSILPPVQLPLPPDPGGSETASTPSAE